jgi:hypothetical protein
MQVAHLLIALRDLDADLARFIRLRSCFYCSANTCFESIFVSRNYALGVFC